MGPSPVVQKHQTKAEAKTNTDHLQTEINATEKTESWKLTTRNRILGHKESYHGDDDDACQQKAVSKDSILALLELRFLDILVFALAALAASGAFRKRLSLKSLSCTTRTQSYGFHSMLVLQPVCCAVL
jgi:hypothetical protein